MDLLFVVALLHAPSVAKARLIATRLLRRSLLAHTVFPPVADDARHLTIPGANFPDMDLKPGLKLRSTADATELVVVRAGSGAGELTCGGRPMVEATEATAAAGVIAGHEGPTQLGKRYTDEESGIEVLCTKPGDGVPAVSGRPLQLKSAKPLPSSD